MCKMLTSNSMPNKRTQGQQQKSQIQASVYCVASAYCL
jgi:hypothetical protein